MIARGWSVRMQLGASFSLLCLCLLLVGGVSLRGLSESHDDSRNFIDGVNARALLVAKIRTAVDARAIAARNLVLSTDPADVARERDAALTAHRAVRTQLAQLQQLAMLPDVSDQARGLIAGLAAIEQRYGEVALGIVNTGAAGDRNAAILRINQECRPLLKELSEQSARYAALTEERSAAVVQAGEAAYRSNRSILLTIAAVALLMAAVLAFRITARLTRALGAEPAQLGEAARRVAEGDLTARQTTPALVGSVMAHLAEMRTGLTDIVTRVRQGSESIATGAAEIAMGNADLSQRTEEQASALQQTAATMDQLGATVKSNAGHAETANRLGQEATRIAERGGEVVGDVVSKMKEIGQSASQITEIIGVIDGIAFQTNILALNAAVEAARAGENGKGFAVVAGEVRSLASKSGEAAKRIKDLIGVSVRQSQEGQDLATRAGATMDEVVGAIGKVGALIGEISAASQEQSSGVSQVCDAVVQMDRVTQQNAALVEESAAAAESLKNQAAHLVELVAQFRIDQERLVRSSVSATDRAC